MRFARHGVRHAALVPALLPALVLALLVPAGAAVARPAPAPVAAHHGHVTKPSYAAQVLELLNVARATPRSCGSRKFGAVGPLKHNAKLQRAAQTFAVKMGKQDFFDHVSPQGDDPGDRIHAEGYRYRSYGENIAAGYDTPQSVVAGWLTSPGHCTNIMTAYKDLGVGYAKVPHSTYTSYWVTDLATR